MYAGDVSDTAIPRSVLVSRLPTLFSHFLFPVYWSHLTNRHELPDSRPWTLNFLGAQARPYAVAH